jgi:hypothetical protein
MDHWTLGRKLREFFAPQGVSEDEANHVLDIMQAVLARTCPGRGSVPAEDAAPPTDKPLAATSAAHELAGLEPAEKLVLDNYHEEDFRRLLGVNIFEGVIWFNKESFEQLLFYAPLFAALESVPRLPKKTGGAHAESPEDWLDRIAGIAELVEAFAGAEKKSGYQLGELLEALGNGSSAKAKGPAKPKGPAEPKGSVKPKNPPAKPRGKK